MKIHKIHTPQHPPLINPRNTPPHSALVATWFGLSSSHTPQKSSLPRFALPTLIEGQIILITGPSGAGKSSLLRRFRRRRQIPITDITRIPLGRAAVIDLFQHIPVETALAHLSRVGLAEAHCYLAPPRHLSDGQRWRLRLALALSRMTEHSYSDPGGMGSCTQMPVLSHPHCLLADEFTTLLDRISAAVVARVLRRAIWDDSSLCALLASSRHDIIRPLSPDLIIRCDFGSFELLKKQGEIYVAQETKAADASVIHSRPLRALARHPR